MHNQEDFLAGNRDFLLSPPHRDKFPAADPGKFHAVVVPQANADGSVQLPANAVYLVSAFIDQGHYKTIVRESLQSAEENAILMATGIISASGINVDVTHKLTPDIIEAANKYILRDSDIPMNITGVRSGDVVPIPSVVYREALADRIYVPTKADLLPEDQDLERYPTIEELAEMGHSRRNVSQTYRESFAQRYFLTMEDLAIYRDKYLSVYRVDPL